MTDTIQGDDLYQHLVLVGGPFRSDVTRSQYMYMLLLQKPAIGETTIKLIGMAVIDLDSSRRCTGTGAF